MNGTAVQAMATTLAIASLLVPLAMATEYPTDGAFITGVTDSRLKVLSSVNGKSGDRPQNHPTGSRLPMMVLKRSLFQDFDVVRVIPIPYPQKPSDCHNRSYIAHTTMVK